MLSTAPSAAEFVEHVTHAVDPWKRQNGAKLMEHSYIGNEVPGAVMARLFAVPSRVVWAGDYADEEPSGKNLYNFYDKVPDLDTQPREYRFLLNLEAREYVDLEAVPEIPDWAGNRIHPLPLLTCESNGRGGGDFRGDNPFIGTWSRALLTVSDTPPEGYWVEITPNFREV